MNFDIRVTGEGVIAVIAILAILVGILGLCYFMQAETQAFYDSCVRSGGYSPGVVVCIR